MLLKVRMNLCDVTATRVYRKIYELITSRRKNQEFYFGSLIHSTTVLCDMTVNFVDL